MRAVSTCRWCEPCSRERGGQALWVLCSPVLASPMFRMDPGLVGGALVHRRSRGAVTPQLFAWSMCCRGSLGVSGHGKSQEAGYVLS